MLMRKKLYPTTSSDSSAASYQQGQDMTYGDSGYDGGETPMPKPVDNWWSTGPEAPSYGNDQQLGGDYAPAMPSDPGYGAAEPMPLPKPYYDPGAAYPPKEVAKPLPLSQDPFLGDK